MVWSRISLCLYRWNRQMDSGQVNGRRIFYHSSSARRNLCALLPQRTICCFCVCRLSVTPFRNITLSATCVWVSTLDWRRAFVQQIWFGLTLAYVTHMHGRTQTNKSIRVKLRWLSSNLERTFLSAFVTNVQILYLLFEVGKICSDSMRTSFGGKDSIKIYYTFSCEICSHKPWSVWSIFVPTAATTTTDHFIGILLTHCWRDYFSIISIRIIHTVFFRLLCVDGFSTER